MHVKGNEKRRENDASTNSNNRRYQTSNEPNHSDDEDLSLIPYNVSFCEVISNLVLTSRFPNCIVRVHYDGHQANYDEHKEDYPIGCST